mgnify:CR=1 FL=1
MNDLHEFKPLLIEIEDKPLNPLGRIILYLVLAIMVFGTAWLILAKVDVVVSAQGKVIPSGEIKILKPLESGVVSKIFVKESDRGKKGDILIQIDPTVTDASLSSKQDDLAVINSDIALLEALINESNLSKDELNKLNSSQISLYNSQKQILASTYESNKAKLNSAKLDIKASESEVNRLSLLLNKEEEAKVRLQKVLDLIAKKEYEEVSKNIINLKEQKERAKAEQHEVITRLEREYFKAINEARRAINLDDTKEKQRALNRANEAKRAVQKPEISAAPELKVGDRVKYGKIKGVVASLSKNDAVIQADNVSMRVPINQLKISGETPAPAKKSGINLSVQKPQNASVTLDLHGLRADEAVQKLDKFISDSLVMGFDEVQVYHGIGTGKLAYAVKNFLREHPSVKEFFDAPAGQGGFGAQIVRL